MLLELTVALAIGMADGGKVPVPPVVYQGDGYSEIQFVSNPILMQRLCGSEPGDSIIACYWHEDGMMYMPNPCLHQDESYARTLCHEMGHANGWRGHEGQSRD